MLENTIDNKINSMDKRKILFIIGEHGTKKTKEAINYLKMKFGDNYKDHYIDIGLYIKNKLDDDMIKTYEIYPKKFNKDCETLFSDLINEKMNGKGNILVLDHMEFMLSENFMKWIDILEEATLYSNTAIVIIPTEYKGMLPIYAYQCIEMDK